MRPTRGFSGFLRRVRDVVEYGALLAGETFVVSLPPRVGDAFAMRLAHAYWLFDGPRRRTTLENLRVAFGDALDDAQRTVLARRSFEESFRTVLHFALAPRLLRGRGMRRRIVCSADFDRLLADVRAGRGGVLLSAHLGGWELSVARILKERVPLRVVARSVGNPLVDARAARWRGGMESVIEKHGAVRGALRWLRAGGSVAMLSDQNAGSQGAFVPFFGLAASTSPIGALLAVRAGVPIYMGIVRRLGKGFAYEATFHRYDVDPSADRHVETRRILDAYMSRLETWIRRWPEQYMWMHRRWKTRPPGETPGPHLPTYDRRVRATAPLPSGRVENAVETASAV